MLIKAIVVSAIMAATWLLSVGSSSAQELERVDCHQEAVSIAAEERQQARDCLLMDLVTGREYGARLRCIAEHEYCDHNRCNIDTTRVCQPDCSLIGLVCDS